MSRKRVRSARYKRIANEFAGSLRASPNIVRFVLRAVRRDAGGTARLDTVVGEQMDRDDNNIMCELLRGTTARRVL